MLPEPRLARQIVETLGQSGTPLSKGVSYYNAGNESLLAAIDAHYLGSYLADGGAVFKLVVGDYGSGKSHFLYCVRDRAWQRNFAVSKVDLSPKESPYDGGVGADLARTRRHRRGRAGAGTLSGRDAAPADNAERPRFER
jgi:hypothetical protein